MDNYIQTLNYAIIHNIRMPLTVVITVFALFVAATVVMVVRELKKQKK